MLIKRILTTSGAILAGAVLCVGCGSSGTPSTSVVANPTTVTATTTVVKTVRSTTEQTVTTTVTAGADGYPPTDFYDHGNGVYSAFETNHDAFTCDAEFNRCWGVKITAPAGCPNGVALTLTIFPVGSDIAAATVEQSTGVALAPQEISTVVVGSSKLPDDEKYEAEVTAASCA